jgi:hypothetical protein
VLMLLSKPPCFALAFSGLPELPHCQVHTGSMHNVLHNLLHNHQPHRTGANRQKKIRYVMHGTPTHMAQLRGRGFPNSSRNRTCGACHILGNVVPTLSQTSARVHMSLVGSQASSNASFYENKGFQTCPFNFPISITRPWKLPQSTSPNQ